jgi:hypothetical protein
MRQNLSTDLLPDTVGEVAIEMESQIGRTNLKFLNW